MLFAPSVAVVALIVVGTQIDRHSASQDVPNSTFNTTPTRDEIDQAIHSAARYLCAQIKESGQFEYRINLNDEIAIAPRYNILRHAGTIYALGMYHEEFPSAETEAAILSAGSFLRQQIAPLAQKPHLSAVWSRHDVDNNFEPDQAKLGGTGLGLVALLCVERVQPGATDVATLRKLGEFLLYMQKPDGGFYSKHVPDEGGFSEWESLYYPGEAALGLIMLHGRYPDDRWLRGAIAAIERLAKNRRDQREVPHDHWALLATARIWPHLRPDDNESLRALLADHAERVCEAIVHGQNNVGGDSLRGSFDREGRITPCATRLEGLLAAHMNLPSQDNILRQRVSTACNLGARFLLDAQIREGPAAGGFPRSIFGHPSYTSFAGEELSPRSSEVRIDYVQHALCALLQYRRDLDQ
jgi:hypothetical protein